MQNFEYGGLDGWEKTSSSSGSSACVAKLQTLGLVWRVVNPVGQGRGWGVGEGERGGGGGGGQGRRGREGEGGGRDEGGKARRRGRNGNKIIAKGEMEGSGEALSRLRVGQRFVFNSTVLPGFKTSGCDNIRGWQKRFYYDTYQRSLASRSLSIQSNTNRYLNQQWNEEPLTQ